MKEKILVTGAGGCIGAWTLWQLYDAGIQPIAFDLSPNQSRLRLLRDQPADADNIPWECGDISDFACVQKVIAKHQPAAIIHLAALQVPFCKADPTAGAQVNVVGTVNVFEAAKQAGIKRLAYASSVAADAMEADTPWLETLYGAYKVCNEQTARVYWQDAALPSIGIRPSIVYGGARDQGISAAPTMAMLAACANLPYTIPFRGKVGFVYAAEVAAAFIQAVAQPHAGAAVFNLNGNCQTVESVLQQIQQQHPQAQVNCSGSALPFPAEISDAPLQAYIGNYRQYSFASGLAETLNLFNRRLQEQRLDASAMLEHA